MKAIFKRELRGFFHGMMGYVLTAFLMAATGLYFLALNLGYGLTDFSYYTLYRTLFILLLYVPVLTMRSLAEERRTRTDQLLLTSPVSVGGIVLGKFFAMCAVFAVPCLLDVVMILILWALGGTVFTGLAVAASLIAGLRTRSFVFGCLLLAALCMGLSGLFLLRSAWLTEAFSAVLGALCLFTPFEEFVNNNFSIPTLVYYLSVMGLFLFFTAQCIEKRRWN